jgi:DNA polymerase III subunit delta'
MAFRDVLGQERAKRFLKQLLHLDKVPHAVLLSGMKGVGKMALAREFATLLNCLNPDGFDSCDTCASCRKMRDDHHPDLLWVRSDGAYIKLDQIRSLKQRLAFRPFEGKWRIVILEDAQNLREEAGNALLKLLEEPPKQNLFVLTALEPQMLLPTIVSRCCHIRLQPLEEALIARHLTATHGLGPSQAQRIAGLAEGSLDRAKLLAEPDRMAHLNEILENVSKLSELSMVEFFPFAAQWAKGSQDLEQDLECIKLWIRDIVLSRLVADYHPMLQIDDGALMKAQKTSVESLLSLFVEIENAHSRIRQNANKQLTLEGVCLAIKENLYGESRWNSIPQGREDLSF